VREMALYDTCVMNSTPIGTPAISTSQVPNSPSDACSPAVTLQPTAPPAPAWAASGPKNDDVSARRPVALSTMMPTPTNGAQPCAASGRMNALSAMTTSSNGKRKPA